MFTGTVITQMIAVTDNLHASLLQIYYRQHCAQRSASRRYLVYSQADFEVFAPQGRHVAPMGVKFGTSSVPNFTPIGATTRV